MRKLIPAIWKALQSAPIDMQALRDFVDVCEHYVAESPEYVTAYLRQCSDLLEKRIPCESELSVMQEMYDLHRRVCKAGAQQDFHLYLLFIEWNREPRKKFYPPRRKALKSVVNALQEMADDKLDLLTISLPPGAGKSTLAIFFLCWLAGKYPDLPILTGSHSNAFVRGAYDECLRVMDPQGEYLWSEVFTGVAVSGTNAKDCRIDLGARKRFETLEFTSIGSGNAGLYRAGTLLYCDDLVPGIEVALSKERLDKLWETYTTDLRQRKIGACKELHIATRWSVHDVIGRLESQYGGNPRAKFIVIPALDENDESNFDYPYGVGFTTEFYRQQREIMDDASWRALYMNEPIEREGLLYHESELQYYFELPEGVPDAILAVCDTKDRGADYCVMPIVYQFGRNFFVEDFICDNSNPDVVEARLIQTLLKHNVHLARFESNSAGGRIAANVQKGILEKSGRTKISTKFSTSNKETRIITAAGVIKDHFLFKDKDSRNREYNEAMRWLLSYTMAGKNKHDDVPDALSMMVDFVDSQHLNKVEVFKRPF